MSVYLYPAINVGLSVSRVGGNAQIKSMKQIAGTLKVDQAQYREMEAFAKFGSDLDASTQAMIDKGSKNVEILKQKQYVPMKVGNQVAIIYCGTKGLLKNVPVDKVGTVDAYSILTRKLYYIYLKRRYNFWSKHKISYINNLTGK